MIRGEKREFFLAASRKPIHLKEQVGASCDVSPCSKPGSSPPCSPHPPGVFSIKLTGRHRQKLNIARLLLRANAWAETWLRGCERLLNLAG